MDLNSASKKADEGRKNMIAVFWRLIWLGLPIYLNNFFYWILNKCPKCTEQLVWYRIHKGMKGTRIKICTTCFRVNDRNIIVVTGFFHGSVYIFLALLCFILSFRSCSGNNREQNKNSNTEDVSGKTAKEIYVDVSSKR